MNDVFNSLLCKTVDYRKQIPKGITIFVSVTQMIYLHPKS